MNVIYGHNINANDIINVAKSGITETDDIVIIGSKSVSCINIIIIVILIIVTILLLFHILISSKTLQ